jgi:alkanesulfonate monooxygenase SsuD/methylene tetrahydromethanopterin reductase-like flavin-dependent oxidoreductase (luciferase family)
MPHLEIWYDMRRPDFATATAEQLYGAMLDQCAWADSHGFDAVTLGEHHSAEDGYLPSPVTLGAVVAGRTRSLRVRMIILAPFYSPLRLAEDLTVLALGAPGRIVPVIVGGYRPLEFEVYGLELKARRATVDETLEVLRRAWQGEPFEYHGRRVEITPKLSEPPPLVTGGSFPSVARRAAKLADGFRGATHALYE